MGGWLVLLRQGLTLQDKPSFAWRETAEELTSMAGLI
jgi:hypothetical protein